MESLGARVADARFELSVLRRAGVIGGDRPDRALRALFALAVGGQTLPTALRVAALKQPDRVALVDRYGSLTYSEVDRRTDAVGAGLLALGLDPGDSVAVLCRNGRGLVESALGAAKAGIDVVFLNTMFSAPQVADVLKSEGVSALVHDPEFVAIADAVSTDVAVIPVERPGPGGASVESAPSIETMAADPGEHRLPHRREPSRFVILTSGTTGRPKGARRSTASGLLGMAAMLDRIPRQSGETVVIAAPLFHSWGFVNFALSLTLGATIVLDGKFDPGRTVELLVEHGARTLVAVPVMLQRMIGWADRDEVDLPALQLEVTAVSGSALPGRLAIEWMDRFGENLYSLYGSTEVAFVSVAGPGELRLDPGTAGPPLRGTDVRLFDEQGRQVPEGDTGRIFASSGMLFEGYSDGSDKERIDGYVSTGDVGRLDGNLLRVDGRDDEMVVSGGENVFPREVEDEIASMEGVVEVAVLGAEDERFGQALVAYVVAEPGREPDPEEIREHVRTRLASFKVPREVEFLDRLPRNETGKVVKRQIDV